MTGPLEIVGDDGPTCEDGVCDLPASDPEVGLST